MEKVRFRRKEKLLQPNIWILWSDIIFPLFGTQDDQLQTVRLERDSKRRQKEQMTDEKNKLVAHIELLKRFVIILGIHPSSAQWKSIHLWQLPISSHEF